MNMNTQKMSQRIGDFEPKALSISPVLVDRNVFEKKKKKKKKKTKKVGKSYKPNSSVASPIKSFEPNLLSLSAEFNDENIAEKKKQKWVGNSHEHWVSEARKDHISRERSFPQHTRKSLSVEIQSADKCSTISGQGSAESESDWLLEDDVVSCSKRVGLEDTTNQSHRGFGNDGKENWHFGWNRRQYNDREGHVNGGKKPSYRIRMTDVNQAENRSWAEKNTLANDNILATPLNSYGQNNAREGHVSWAKKPTSYRIGVKDNNQAENHSWAERSSLANEGIWPTRLISSGTNNAANGYRRDRNMPPRLLYESSSQGDASPQNLSGILYVSVQGSTNSLKPVKSNMREGPPNFGVNFSASSLERVNCNMREGLGAHDAKFSEACSLEPVNCNMRELPRNYETNFSLGHGKCVSYHQPMSHDNPKVQSTAKKGEKMESRGYDAKCRGAKDTGQLFLVGSQIGMKALHAAYQMHLASETVQLAMGYPLAEFEKFIQCAAPVVPSSYVHKECSIRLDTQLSYTLLCKHQIPNVSLHSVWNWYEIPGNYGLDIKVSTPKTLTGAPNDSETFRAYYVPYLSAIQLFGPHIPGSKRSSSLKSLKEAFHNHIQFGSVDASLSHGSDPCSPVFSTDAELIFEFFDVELPHHRRPFYNKILELIDAGTSNPHVFGDPSKLASLNLRDLHPASWFSVAWYPIYQIPEGHLRASFLTYHSLGHFVQRSGSGDSPNGRLGHIFFPTLGLQSYNSHDECWFEPKIPSSEEPTSFDTASILIKRLRSLDENALRFSRGWVHKDKDIVQNRHPDYDFFVSRKAHFARRAIPYFPVT